MAETGVQAETKQALGREREKEVDEGRERTRADQKNKIEAYSEWDEDGAPTRDEMGMNH